MKKLRADKRKALEATPHPKGGFWTEAVLREVAKLNGVTLAEAYRWVVLEACEEDESKEPASA